MWNSMAATLHSLPNKRETMNTKQAMRPVSDRSGQSEPGRVRRPQNTATRRRRMRRRPIAFQPEQTRGANGARANEGKQARTVRTEGGKNHRPGSDAL